VVAYGVYIHVPNVASCKTELSFVGDAKIFYMSSYSEKEIKVNI